MIISIRGMSTRFMAAADSLKLSLMATGVNVLAWAALVLGFQLHREEMLSNLAVIFVLILTVASGLLTTSGLCRVRPVVVGFGMEHFVADQVGRAVVLIHLHLCACGLWAGLRRPPVSVPLVTFTSKLTGSCLGG